MDKKNIKGAEFQMELFEKEVMPALLDQLFAESKLYKSGADYQELMDFVVRLRQFAPFNAMLLSVQKPGLLYAATARDWHERFGRKPKEGVRPLLIMWPFGPVALVYDSQDTEGDALPKDAEMFPVKGELAQDELKKITEKMTDNRYISLLWRDEGDGKAGMIVKLTEEVKDQSSATFQIHVNQNHKPANKLVTIVHELAHLYLGHLGKVKALNIPKREKLTHAQVEIEAESVAYIVCNRKGLKPKSQKYLSNYIDGENDDSDIAVYRIMRAAGQIESLLGFATK